MSDAQTTILIVDDEPVNLMVLRENLEGAGYLVVEAASGEEAITRLEEHDEVQLVLLDWMMPGMSGIEVLEKIRSTEKTETVPVIMQTANDEKEKVVEAIGKGANDYIVKPLQGDVLLPKVQRALEKAAGSAAQKSA